MCNNSRTAAYRSRIYGNLDTPTSQPYFVQSTYVPHMCDVPATFPWRFSDVSVFSMEFHFRMYGMCYVRVTYARRIKCDSGFRERYGW